jgi:hypothetical protein
LSVRSTTPTPGCHTSAEFVAVGVPSAAGGPPSTVPSTIGTPTARAARSIAAAASGLRSGSMSLAFSGHSTRSGRGRRPAAASAASCSVTRTWLSSTARRCALKSRPRRGTLPCTAAIVTVRTGAPPVGGTSAASGPASSAAAATAAATAAPRTWPRTSRRAASPSASPASTAANDSSGAPPTAATGSSGPSGWPNATRPHGNPPKGTRARTASTPTQTAAAHSGAPRSREVTAIPAPAAPTNSASAPESASHGTGPT